MIQLTETQPAEMSSSSEHRLPKEFVLPDLVPVRMLNEFCYCPRLAYLEWVQSEFEDSSDTVEGRLRHRRVDREKGDLASPDEIENAEFDAPQTRSLQISAPGIGLIAKIDLVETREGLVYPVDYKRGKVPDIPEMAYEPERVQLCAQALIIRENGYRCETGVLYYVSSKKRVEIPITEELANRTKGLLDQMRTAALKAEIPPPLIDSPKCPRCSLVGICLPDEINCLAEKTDSEIRKLVPGRDDAMPLAVQHQGGRVGKKGNVLQVKGDGEILMEARVRDTSQVMLFGAVQISTQCVHELLKKNIPVLYFSYGNWFHGITNGLGHKNIERRITQFRAAENPQKTLTIAKRLIRDKAGNCRTLLRRNIPDCSQEPLNKLKREIEKIEDCESLESLLGHEGNVARIYFEWFPKMFKSGHDNIGTFNFESRNRRPPRDPVNAMLSLAYSLLVKDLTVTVAAVGFDPFLGFYHQPRYGRPALALDLMEPFRPLIADSVVFSCINNGVVTPDDFDRVGGACSMTADARKKMIMNYERRMDSLITHPVFEYRISYRRILEVQCRLLARYLEGEIQDPPSFVTR